MEGGGVGIFIMFSWDVGTVTIKRFVSMFILDWVLHVQQTVFTLVFRRGKFGALKRCVFYSYPFLLDAHKDDVCQAEISWFTVWNTCITSNGVLTCKKAPCSSSSAWYLSNILKLLKLFVFFHFTFSNSLRWIKVFTIGTFLMLQIHKKMTFSNRLNFKWIVNSRMD